MEWLGSWINPLERGDHHTIEFLDLAWRGALNDRRRQSPEEGDSKAITQTNSSEYYRALSPRRSDEDAWQSAADRVSKYSSDRRAYRAGYARLPARNDGSGSPMMTFEM
jgi:hypothetical protein